MRVVEFKELLKEVRDNAARLDRCPRHEYEDKPIRLGDTPVCVKCQGTMALTNIGQYIRGYQAAGQDPEDIWPNWSKHAGPKSREPSS